MLGSNWDADKDRFDPVGYPGELVACARTLPEVWRSVGRDPTLITGRELFELRGWKPEYAAMVV